MSVLRIERVDVDAGRVGATVRVARGLESTSVSHGLAARAFELLPGLARHSCRNEDGLDLRRELAHTQTAHLLEHVACELMALSGSPRSLRAETRWDFARDGRGVYRVALAYDDDLVAVGALSAAAHVVEWLMIAEGEAPDVEALVERLVQVRARTEGA